MSKHVCNLNDLSVKELISELLDNPPDDLFRDMVELELQGRCGEPINGAQLAELMQRCRDQKILWFPRFGHKRYEIEGGSE